MYHFRNRKPDQIKPPDSPEWVRDYSKKIWNVVAPDLYLNEMLFPINTELLGIYCQLIAGLRRPETVESKRSTLALIRRAERVETESGESKFA